MAVFPMVGRPTPALLPEDTQAAVFLEDCWHRKTARPIAVRLILALRALMILVCKERRDQAHLTRTCKSPCNSASALHLLWVSTLEQLLINFCAFELLYEYLPYFPKPSHDPRILT